MQGLQKRWSALYQCTTQTQQELVLTSTLFLTQHFPHSVPSHPFSPPPHFSFPFFLSPLVLLYLLSPSLPHLNSYLILVISTASPSAGPVVCSPPPGQYCFSILCARFISPTDSIRNALTRSLHEGEMSVLVNHRWSISLRQSLALWKWSYLIRCSVSINTLSCNPILNHLYLTGFKASNTSSRSSRPRIPVPVEDMIIRVTCLAFSYPL